ncbi:MAG: hypothetical protein NT018_02435 [Armatimonadetes bacterium]|nr:hypothetical protein [Armatimonadota bacterium]
MNKEMLSRIAEQLNQYSELAATASSVTSMFGQLRLTIAKQNDLMKTMAAFAEMSRRASDVLRHFDSQSLTNDIRNAFPFLLSYGWPPPVELGLGDLRTIMRDQSENDEPAIGRAIEKLVLSCYGNDKLERIHENWEHRLFLKHRLPILRAVMDAHISKNYWLSVPSMLPQIDGVIAEYYGHKGHLSGKKLVEYVEKLFAAQPSNLMGLISSANRDFYTTILLFPFLFGQLPAFISRHAILHGADTGYGTEANSLKVILFFDYLVSNFS